MPEIARVAMTGQVKTNLGRVGFNPRGEYAAGNTYNRLDIVQSAGSGWICLADGTKGVTPAEGAKWMRFADNGSATLLQQVKDSAAAAKASENAAKSSQNAAAASQTAAKSSADSAAASAKTATEAAAKVSTEVVQEASAKMQGWMDTAEKAAESAVAAEGNAAGSAKAANDAVTKATAQAQTAKGYADTAKEYADQAAAEAGAVTVSFGWDSDGYFSMFEQEGE